MGRLEVVRLVFNGLGIVNGIEIGKELLEYNKLDCIVLYQVVHKYAAEIYDMFKLNIHKYPTLSSLAMAIFRSNFYKPTDESNSINITSNEIYNDIKPGYQGGHVDVYKAYGENLYYYDVNSLYPFVMRNNLFPSGPCTYFEGEKALKDLFGIVYANITCPIDLKVPVLLHKHNNVTMAPTGTWSG